MCQCMFVSVLEWSVSLCQEGECQCVSMEYASESVWSVNMSVSVRQGVRVKCGIVSGWSVSLCQGGVSQCVSAECVSMECVSVSVYNVSTLV